MTEPFDSDVLARLGWRQGSILGPKLAHDPLGTDEITLADIEPYQRFDSDWVSFEDDTSTTPATVDMTS